MGTDERPPQPDPRALQDEICSLPGIRAARVVPAPTGRIAEIHVVAEEGKSAKQVVRDIQTLALARFGIQLDYRVVSVVQLGREPTPTASPGPPRPVLSSISWQVEGARSTCRVDLAYGDVHRTGEAAGPATSHSRLRLAAQAAAEAVQTLDSLEATLEVADVLLTEAAHRRVAVVVLILLSQQGEEVLAGAAVVKTDEADAIVRAVLDAVNRRLTRPAG